MSATAEQIARVRRMIAEPNTTTYQDTEVQAMIEAHPLMDVNGEWPWIMQSVTLDPANMVNPVWIPTYDLNAAAADLWEEKAGALAADYDFEADGAQYSRSQAYEQSMKQARYYRSRRSPKTMTMAPAYPGTVDPDKE